MMTRSASAPLAHSAAPEGKERRVDTRHSREGQVAVLSGTHLNIGTTGLDLSTVREVGELVSAADAYQVRAIWLLGEQGDPDWWRGEAVRYAAWPKSLPGEPQAAPTMASVRATGREIFVCDLAREMRWPFGELVDARGVLATIARIEEAIDAPLTWTPATVGLRLVERTYGFRKGEGDNSLRFRDSAAPADLPHINPCALHWARPLTVEESDAPYWHFFDLNAAYVAAAQSTPLGAGTPTRESFGHDDLAGRRAGIWPVTVRGDNPVIRFAGWYDTAVVRAALAASSAQIDIGSGLVWNISPYGLRRWADRLWGARQVCEQKGDSAGVATVKAIYTQAFGSLNSATRGDTPSPYYRPHWYEAIRGESTRRTWAAVQKWGAFCANVDMIGFVASSPDPCQAFPDLTARRAGLGGWKPALSLAPSPELRELARKGSLSASQIVKAARKEAASDGSGT